MIAKSEPTADGPNSTLKHKRLESHVPGMIVKRVGLSDSHESWHTGSALYETIDVKT